MSPSWLSGGALPLGFLLALLALWYRRLRGKGACSRNEALQGIFIFLTAVFLVLTATGIWFRGEGMALRLPWP